MAAGAAAGIPSSGLFPPDSVAWRVNRESVILAGGTCALLMQLAHPAVAAGVAAHSTFRADPFARLRRTLGTSWAIAFGSGQTADSAIRRVNVVHRSVRGVVPETGAPYDALDPTLLLWVHATLIDTAVRMHERFLAPLSEADRDAYHRQAARVAILLGVPANQIPDTLAGLRAWMAGLIASGEVRVGPTARGLLPAILYPTPFPPRAVWDLAHLASISVLHPDIRRQYGLTWNASRARGVIRLAAVSRRLTPRLPAVMRHVPASRRTAATGLPSAPPRRR